MHSKSLLLFILLTSSFNALAIAPRVIYGEDDRKDAYEIKSALYKMLSQSTAAQIHQNNISHKGTVADLIGSALSETIPWGMRESVCTKEKFAHQPVVANCSGFMISDDLLVTAGHCIQTLNDCTDFKWVFDYKISDEHQSAVSVAPQNVYSCQRIVKQALTNDGLDFAILKLDRPAPGRAVKLATVDPKVGTGIVMIGHPSGLPQKFSDEAKVTDVYKNGFFTNLDAFKGNSGSAVFNASTGELLGILVNGDVDYMHNNDLNCSEVNVINKPGGEGVSSFRQFQQFL